jgi:hypothetical protein
MSRTRNTLPPYPPVISATLFSSLISPSEVDDEPLVGAAPSTGMLAGRDARPFQE